MYVCVFFRLRNIERKKNRTDESGGLKHLFNTNTMKGTRINITKITKRINELSLRNINKI